MADGHGHYQQLAVGHVLGGLGPDDAADFRSHLAGCRDCRARVAELRGIASDLERAERDERAREVVRTEVARREPEAHEAPASGSRIGVRHVTVAVVVVVFLAGAMAFWNLHLRTSNAVVTSVAEQHAQTLAVLASGIEVDVEADHPVGGIGAVDGDRVAVALTGVEVPQDARVVAWLHGADGPVAAAQVVPAQIADSHLALVLEDADAGRLELSVEQGELGDRPAERPWPRST